MNKKAIYSCYKCPADNRPKFLDLHIQLAEKYASKIGADFVLLQNIDKEYKPLTFVAYEAYKHFAESKYERMLWIDWDVLISLDSPDIFNEYSDVGFAAWKWPYSETYNFSEFAFLEHVCHDVVSDDDIKKLFNGGMYDVSGGVMLFDNDTMNKFLFGEKAQWDALYSVIHDDLLVLPGSLRTREIDDLLKVGGELSHYVINYLLYKNEIPVSYIDKRWNTNSITNMMSQDEYFFNFNDGGDEVDTGQEFNTKNNTVLDYVLHNKHKFFDTDDEFSTFISQYDKKTIFNALKKR